MRKNGKENQDTEVRLLTPKDLHAVQWMDVVSGFCVEQWIEDNTDYAWGLFLEGNFVGYCTIGYADDVHEAIKESPEYTSNSLLLSDVFVRPEYRKNGYGSQLIKEVIHKRWKLDGQKNSVYLIVLYNELANFYQKAGFEIIKTNGRFCGEMVLAAENNKSKGENE